jgi:hypothetical protein
LKAPSTGHVAETSSVLKKKNEKTFAKPGFGLSGQAEAKMIKGFLLLVFKKKSLLRHARP